MRKSILSSLFTFILISASLFLIPNANAGIVDCLSFGAPSVSSSASSISVSILVKVNCTSKQLGYSNGAVLSIVEEGSFGPSCSGLYALSAGGSSTISCSIPLTGGFASTRYGATSSTIKVWFAWDSSTKFISFSHAAIKRPATSGTTSGTTTSSTGGNTSGGLTSTSANLNNARFVNLTNSLMNSTVEADGKQTVTLTIRVTSANNLGVRDIPVTITVSGVGILSNSSQALNLSTDSNGEAKVTLTSIHSGISTVTASTSYAGQFNDFYGIVGGVQATGIKAGNNSASNSITFEPSSESLLIAQDAIDAANEFTDAAEPYGTSKEGLAALEAANVVARLEVKIDDLIAVLKKQIALLNAFKLKIKASGN